MHRLAALPVMRDLHHHRIPTQAGHRVPRLHVCVRRLELASTEALSGTDRWCISFACAAERARSILYKVCLLSAPLQRAPSRAGQTGFRSSFNSSGLREGSAPSPAGVALSSLRLPPRRRLYPVPPARPPPASIPRPAQQQRKRRTPRVSFVWLRRTSDLESCSPPAPHPADADASPRNSDQASEHRIGDRLRAGLDRAELGRAGRGRKPSSASAGFGYAPLPMRISEVEKGEARRDRYRFNDSNGRNSFH